VHCAKMIITQPNRIIKQPPDILHRIILCLLLGLVILVRSATTASLGIANESIPGQKPARVYKIAPDFCSSESRAK